MLAGAGSAVCCRLVGAAGRRRACARPAAGHAFAAALHTPSTAARPTPQPAPCPQAQGDPEFVVENVLALVLVGLAALAVGNILLKLLIVCYSLVAAAVRYTAVGLFLAVLLLAVQPGRWWF